MPSQSFQAAAVTPADFGTAWRALQRSETWDGIAGVESVHDPVHDERGNLKTFGFAASVGGVRYQGTASVMSSEEPNHIRLELSTSEMVATIDVHLGETAESDSTTVTVDLAIRSRSFLARMFFPAISDSIGRGIERTTVDFASRLRA